MSQPVGRRSFVTQLLVTALSLGVASLILLNRQTLWDAFNYYTYAPPAAIGSIAERSRLSDKGEYLFYATRPSLLSREPFNDACRSVAVEKTAILGCYTGIRIYLFDIENNQLDGIEEVTAAHEMLHAAYERLPNKERNRVNKLLQAQPLGKDTSRVNELMAEYAKSEPGQHFNELHSIIGSEVRDLTPELENYYSQYFTDRSSLVTLAESYQSVFDALRLQQNELAQSLNGLADAIDAATDAYRRSQALLSADIEQFNTDAASGSMTRAEFESRRADLVARQTNLREEYNNIQSMISEYEKQKSELAAINSQSDALNRSINSSLEPVPGGLDG